MKILTIPDLGHRHRWFLSFTVQLNYLNENEVHVCVGKRGEIKPLPPVNKDGENLRVMNGFEPSGSIPYLV
jgi:hypothetical protein